MLLAAFEYSLNGYALAAIVRFIFTAVCCVLGSRPKKKCCRLERRVNVVAASVVFRSTFKCCLLSSACMLQRLLLEFKIRLLSKSFDVGLWLQPDMILLKCWTLDRQLDSRLDWIQCWLLVGYGYFAEFRVHLWSGRCLGTWMYVFSCLNLTCWILHSPLARTIKLDMQHSRVNIVDTVCSLCRYREWPGLRQGHLSYDSTKTSAVLPSSCVEIGAVQPCLQPWLRCTSSAACIP